MINDNLTLVSCPLKGSTAVASTILEKKVKLYGPQNVLKDSDKNCWNSDQGEKQFLVIKFGRTISVQKLCIEFQAGFVSEILRVYGKADDDNAQWKEIDEFDVEDSLQPQIFELEELVKCKELRLEFEECRDFYGRITVYRLQVWGNEQEEGTVQNS
mmetsp:Transcript_14647/g.16759  ORF Transcript_14647/g.16759 Transcript_14647/m.16759 type:complete len:157 (-) Transcript_14647:184-654(-)